ncbi:MAG TPA: hypothetical protein VGE07_23035 [Herpetosiphonaceae bacterium]
MQTRQTNRSPLRPYLDGSLIAFVVVMVAAAAITSHGTFVFYAYILPVPLAVAATIVLTAGIPLLELAAVLDKASRPRYIAGMIVLLAMEGIAQYFQGQAIFVQAVRRQFPEAKGIDVATFAQQPWGRVLPLLYLAALSGVVVYFGYAASARIRTIRAGQTDAALTAQQLTDLAQLRTQAAQQAAEIAQLVADLGTRDAHQQHATAQWEQTAAQWQQTLAQRDDLLARQERDLAQLRELAAQPLRAGDLDLMQLAQALREPRAIPWREIEELIGVAQSTLRARLKSAPLAPALEVAA